MKAIHAAGLCALLVISPPVLANDTPSYANLVLAALVLGALGWLAWAVYWLSPLRTHLHERRMAYQRWIYLLLSAVALGSAALSVLLGKTTIGSGVVIRAIEAQQFWQLVALQVGAGFALLIFAVLSRKS